MTDGLAAALWVIAGSVALALCIGLAAWVVALVRMPFHVQHMREVLDNLHNRGD